MGMENYFNPNSIRPAYNWQPEGALAGQAYAEDRQRYQQTAGVQDLMQMLSLMEQQQKMEESRLDQPVKAAKRETDLSSMSLERLLNTYKSDPNFIRTMQQGEMGKANEAQARGSKLLQMLDSDVQTGLAANRAEAAGNRYKQLGSEIGFIHQMLPMLEQAGPPGSPQSQNAYQQILQGAPPNLRNQLPQAYSPQVGTALRKSLMDSPQFLHDLEKIAKEGENRLAVQKEANKGSANVASIGANAPSKMKENDQQRFNALMKKAGSDEGLTREEASELTFALSNRIENSPSIKELSKTIDFEMMKDKGDPARAMQNVKNAMAEKWDDLVPPQVQTIIGNPYRKKKKPPTEKPDNPETNTGIPGVIRR